MPAKIDRCADGRMSYEGLRRVFDAKVTRPYGYGCWEWIGARDRFGRGMQHDGIRLVTAPRVAWYLHYGEWPDAKLYVCHTCDNTACVRPSHLFLGTAQDNIVDAFRKGRIVRPSGVDCPAAKLDTDRAAAIRTLYATGKFSQETLGEMFGVRQTTISTVVRRVRWM